MKLLRKEQKLYKNAKICYICKENFEDKYVIDKKNIAKLEIIAVMQGCPT